MLRAGAGLASPEEQAEAAYADLLLTSMGDSELSSEEMQELQKGGEMPKEKRTGGILDLVQGEQLARRVSL